MEDLNRYDNNGMKTGLWIEYPLEGRRTEVYYQDGVEHGLFRIFDRDYLSIMGEYDHGIPCGVIFYFDKRFLKSKVYQIRQIRTEDNGLTWFRGRFVGYYPSGIISEIGDIIWHTGIDPISDFSIQVGEWKYYREDGQLLIGRAFPVNVFSDGSASTVPLQ